MTKRKKKPTSQVLDAVKGRGRGTPRLEELVEHFFIVAGGPRKVAVMMYDEYVAAPAGSQARSRILATLTQCMKFITSRSDLRGDDISLLSEADLEEAIVEIVDGEEGAENAEGDRGAGDPAPGQAAPSAPASPGPDPPAAGDTGPVPGDAARADGTPAP